MRILACVGRLCLREAASQLLLWLLVAGGTVGGGGQGGARGEKFLTSRVGSGSGSKEERIGEPLHLIPWSGRARGGRRRLELRRPIAATWARQGLGGKRAGRAGVAEGGSHSGGRPCRGVRRGSRRSAGYGAARSARDGAMEERRNGETQCPFFKLFNWADKGTHVHVSRCTSFKCQLSAYRWARYVRFSVNSSKILDQ
jgi:hypothetical protein